MAKVAKVGDELILELSFWEKMGALHSSPRTSIDSVEKVEFFDELWGSSTLRGVRAPGTALPLSRAFGDFEGCEISGFCGDEGQGRRGSSEPKKWPFCPMDLHSEAAKVGDSGPNGRHAEGVKRAKIAISQGSQE